MAEAMHGMRTMLGRTGLACAALLLAACAAQAQELLTGTLAKARTSGASRATIASASRSLSTSGGSRRITLSCVTLMSMPRASAVFTSSPQGRSSSTPIIRPSPRTCLTPAKPPMRSRKASTIQAPRFCA
jgi:hypothetical protein